MKSMLRLARVEDDCTWMEHLVRDVDHNPVFIAPPYPSKLEIANGGQVQEKTVSICHLIRISFIFLRRLRTGSKVALKGLYNRREGV